MTEKKKPEPVSTKEVVKAQTGALRRFSAVPKEVNAVQFRGWENAYDIFQVVPSFYVPMGKTHPLRPNSEYTAEGLLGEAPEFLVLSSHGQKVRVDLFSWIILFEDDHIEVWPDEVFSMSYSEKVIA